MLVTVYGDSILKGVLLEDGKYHMDRSWEQLLTERLGLQVRNRSHFGCTIRKALPAIRRGCRDRSGGEELALLELGGNDCDYDWAAIARDPEGSYDCKTPPETFETQYREAVHLLRESGRQPIIATLPPIHSERYLRFICRDGLNRDNILRWLGDVEAISRWQAAYSAIVRRIAGEEDVPLIDLRSPFPQEPQLLAEYLCEDGIHPSHRGQAMIYDTLCAGAAAL